MAAVLLLTHCGARPSKFAAAWETYAARFVEGGRVIDRDNGDISHSEGQGYGMLFAVAAGDRPAFEELWHWTRDTLERDDGLFSWRFRPCPSMDRGCVDDPNNASDGDILIAWALLQAARRWDHAAWEARARAIVASMRDRLLVRDHGYLFLLPGLDGFVASAEGRRRYRLNLSYYVFPALRAFGTLTGDPDWARLARDGARLLREARIGEQGLHPDWVELGPDGVGAGAEAIYGYNACRIPLHVIWDPDLDRSLLEPYRAFWERDPPPATVDLRSGEGAPYPWSLGMATIARTVTAVEGAARSPFEELPARRVAAAEGYFSASLVLLSLLAWNDLAA